MTVLAQVTALATALAGIPGAVTAAIAALTSLKNFLDATS